MNESLEFYQACVGSGWANLIKECYDICQKYNVVILQVKEKYGGLRFYVGTAPDEVFDVIDEAERKSKKICENCGAPGTARNTGWIKTLCDDCYEIL